MADPLCYAADGMEWIAEADAHTSWDYQQNESWLLSSFLYEYMHSFTCFDHSITYPSLIVTATLI